MDFDTFVRKARNGSMMHAKDSVGSLVVVMSAIADLCMRISFKSCTNVVKSMSPKMITLSLNKEQELITKWIHVLPVLVRKTK
ncbi:hypothetical protein L1987_06782 [Smallanthus sonchifolius]|uniref:Uncharacterized protein n=1 Tax=Smallanthus sonchifolius TaxID=185202 RepID=A0ACB9JZ18_9ASTR|nr:hypothetical protein L1987_06782 [Smallanthus sonchifolius]